MFSGNLAIPHNDAWSHSRIARTFAETGEIKLLFWNRSALLGQIIVLGPLASSLVAQQTFVWFLSIVTLGSIFYIIKDEIGSYYAAISLFLISIYPGFMLLSTSFMTDIPMYAAIFTSLALAKHAIQSDSKLFFLGAMLIGAWGFTIREQALAAPIAIGLASMINIKKSKNLRPKFISLVMVFVLTLLGLFYHWRSGLFGNDTLAIQINPNLFKTFFYVTTQSWFNLSLVAGLAAILVNTKTNNARIKVSFIFGLLVASIYFINFDTRYFFLPGYLSKDGSYANVLPPSLPLFSDIIWNLLVLTSICFGFLTFLVLVLGKKSKNNLLNIYSVITFCGIVLQIGLQQMIFDRYLIAFLPWIFTSIFSNVPDIREVLANAKKLLFTLLSSFLFLISLSLTLHSFAFDRARWEVASIIANSGVPEQRIDGGFEWSGWFSTNGAKYRFDKSSSPGNDWSHNWMFGNRPCFILSTSENHMNWKPDTQQFSYRTFLISGNRNLYVFQTNDQNCSQYY